MPRRRRGTTCLRCRDVRVKCQSRGDGNSCRRCMKFHFHCIFHPSLPTPSPHLSTPIPHPPSTKPTIPTWTHTFYADSNSSNRVRAAAIAFLAQERGSSYYSNLRLLDKNKKKKSKQEKFLIVAAPIIDIGCRLTTSDVKQDLIVFDGTKSYPPPPISPPPK